MWPHTSGCASSLEASWPTLALSDLALTSDSISSALSRPVAAKLSTGSSPARLVVPEAAFDSFSRVEVEGRPPAAIAPGPAGFGFVGAAFFLGGAFLAGNDASSSA